VSVFTTVLSLVTFVVAVSASIEPWRANVLATAIGTVPSYLLNRRWVWRRSTRSDPWREIVPFWALSFAGLGLSTLAVDLADHAAADVHITGWSLTTVLLLANVASFAALWVVQFALLDRVLFRAAPPTAPRHDGVAVISPRTPLADAQEPRHSSTGAPQVRRSA
jgi:putative flippase GtrA